MNLLFLVVAASGAEVTVPVSDANFYFTDYNWFRAGGPSAPTMATANPGATAKLGFANSSYVTLLLNTSRLAPAPAPYPTLKLATSVDDGPWQFWQLSSANRTAPPVRAGAGAGADAGGSADAGAEADIVELTLATATRGSAQWKGPVHEVVLVLFASAQMSDRWLGGGGAAGSSYLEVAGARVADGGGSRPAPSLRPRRMLFYGDSISEGTNAHFLDWRGAGACVPGNELHVNCAFCSWGQVLSRALVAEASQVAFAAAGYSTHVSLQYGNVPPLLTVGDAASSSWDKVDASHSRLQALRHRPPDYVFSAHGFNDQACGGGAAGHGRCTYDMVQASVAAWLGAMRAATSAETAIAVVVPFAGDMGGDQNRTRFAIRAGYASYQNQTQSENQRQGHEGHGQGQGKDPNTFLIDLYPSAKPGLSGGGGATVASCDGTHPLAHAHAQLASLVAVELTRQQAQRGRLHSLLY